MNKKYFLLCEFLALYEGFLSQAKKIAVEKGLIPGTPEFFKEVASIFSKLERKASGGIYKISEALHAVHIIKTKKVIKKSGEKPKKYFFKKEVIIHPKNEDES